ncbi:unnamed protein product [marine sediment metagenome]|uniref:Uncharacterized protein n=1 Tax=marine sediment metagenome TaxID=412755 RepID=X1C365_9ZZZZ
MNKEEEIRKLEALKSNVTQFSDMWIIDMCNKAIDKIKQNVK